MTTTLLTQIDDALTAAAIVIGGAFSYLKFIMGRVLTAAVGYEIRAIVTTHAVTRRHLPHQSLTVPRDSVQLVSVSSITAEELGRHRHDLTQDAVGWKEPPRRMRRSCPHDGGEFVRDALGAFICEVCGRACEDEGADPGRDS